MKVKILGISGSPRHGNSEFLLEQALGAAKSVKPSKVKIEFYSFVGKRFAPCYSCFRCIEEGDCIVKDDFQELRDKWVEADAIIYSVPVYHLSMPAQVKAFIDRLGNSLFASTGDNPPKFSKVIGIITQGTHIFSGQEHTITDLINHALIMGCIPVSGDPWESYIGVGGWTRTDIGVNALRELYEKGDEDAKVAVRAARSLGRRVALTSMIIKAGALAIKDILEEYPSYELLLSKAKKDAGGDKR